MDIMPVAMITGASKGLGRALAGGPRRSAAGTWCWAPGPRASWRRARGEHRRGVRDAGGGGGGGCHRCRAPGELVAAARGLGGLDLLVSNASALGAEPLVRLEALPLDGLRAALETNVVAALGLVQEALPLLRAAGAGAVIDISSDAAAEAYETWGGYGASKAALDHARGGARGGGAGAAGVDGRPGRHADGSVRGGRARTTTIRGPRRRRWCRASCGCWTSGRRAAGTRRPRCCGGGSVTTPGATTGGAADAGGPGACPTELSARVPRRRCAGPGRDDVRLLVSRGTEVSPPRLPGAAGAAAGRGRPGGQHVRHAARRRERAGRRRGASSCTSRRAGTTGAGRWSCAARTARAAPVPRAGGPAGAVVRLPGGERLVLEEPLAPGADRLWWARCRADVPGLLRPVRPADPVRGTRSRTSPCPRIRRSSRCPPPTARARRRCRARRGPSRRGLVAELVSRGVQFAPLTLHTGVASAEAHEPPYPERFEVPATTAWLVNAARAGGGQGHRGRHDGRTGPGVGRGRATAWCGRPRAGRTWSSRRGAGCGPWTGC